MISIDQVLLLEEKVESAVKKIEQLNAENAALRRKCAELSNAFNAKSEQFSTFQNDQSKIEEGILKALSRLNAVENVVLQAAGTAHIQSNQVNTQNTLNQENSNLQSGNQEEYSTQSAGSISMPSATEQPQVIPQTVEQSVQNDSDFSHSETQKPVNTDTLTPDIDFEFGESDSPDAQPINSPVQNPENSEQQAADSSQPMFDIF